MELVVETVGVNSVRGLILVGRGEQQNARALVFEYL